MQRLGVSCLTFCSSDAVAVCDGELQGCSSERRAFHTHSAQTLLGCLKWLAEKRSCDDAQGCLTFRTIPRLPWAKSRAVCGSPWWWYAVEWVHQVISKATEGQRRRYKGRRCSFWKLPLPVGSSSCAIKMGTNHWEEAQTAPSRWVERKCWLEHLRLEREPMLRIKASGSTGAWQQFVQLITSLHVLTGRNGSSIHISCITRVWTKWSLVTPGSGPKRGQRFSHHRDQSARDPRCLHEPRRCFWHTSVCCSAEHKQFIIVRLQRCKHLSSVYVHTRWHVQTPANRDASTIICLSGFKHSQTKQGKFFHFTDVHYRQSTATAAAQQIFNAVREQPFHPGCLQLVRREAEINQPNNNQNTRH